MALAELEARFDSCVVVTQNVDGLHQRAGSRDVVELHGSLHRFCCADCGAARDVMPAADAGAEREVDPPRCPRCDGLVRPGVVWFGERLPADAVERAWDEVGRCEALLVVGTSSLVYPAADLPRLARARGAAIIEINPDPTPLSGAAHVAWRERAGAALPAIRDALDRSGPR
jgi:NAD-dependent deacetylase